MSSGLRQRLARWLGDRPDDAVLRWLYRAVIAATVAVLAGDLLEAVGTTPPEPAVAPRSIDGAPRPAARPLPARQGERDPRRGPLHSRDPQLAAAMRFELLDGGRLMAIGTIGPGTADALAAELAKRGSYVRTVVLHSPGGSVADAIAMGRMIRGRNLATEVESGRYCASSCPLVFAGGSERRAGDKAAIGVRQVFTADDRVMPAALGMESAQRVSAECQNYLGAMGVDLVVWVRAMETPPSELFYFTPDELLSLKLATRAGGGATAAVGRKS